MYLIFHTVYPGWLLVQDIPLSRPTPTLALTSGIAEHNGYLLFLVGEQDTLISGEQREAIARELLAANVRHEMVTYPTTPHGFFCDERERAFIKLQQMMPGSV